MGGTEGHTPDALGVTERIVVEEKAQLDFSQSMSYGDYLHLDEILGAQHLLSPTHDEMLFIVQHQTSELWMKLMLHELQAAQDSIVQEQVAAAFKMLARVSRIMEQLVAAWSVLATMTPTEYTAMRPYLASSSGFQSAQYRCIEFGLGNKNAAMLKPHAHRPELLAMVEQAYRAPSLYDESLRLLARHGLAIPDDHLERDSPAVRIVGTSVAVRVPNHWGQREGSDEVFRRTPGSHPEEVTGPAQPHGLRPGTRRRHFRGHDL